MTAGTASSRAPDQVQHTAPQRLRVSRYFGYAAGDVANNLTFSLASAFLLIYYTDVAGIAAATMVSDTAEPPRSGQLVRINTAG